VARRDATARVCDCRARTRRIDRRSRHRLSGVRARRNHRTSPCANRALAVRRL
jgi:hypothetical protein